MRTGATLGAATVADQSGEVAPDKFQSYMRGIIRATAESQGRDTLIADGDTTYSWKRDPRIAEAMVDPDVEIPGVIEKGKVLTFTASEALQNKYCDAIVQNKEEILLKQYGYSDYELKVFQLSVKDKIAGRLMGTALRAILIMIIVAGIWFELQSPGIGFPSIAAGVAAILYFAPLYLDGLVQYWEIILFVAGVIFNLFGNLRYSGFWDCRHFRHIGSCVGPEFCPDRQHRPEFRLQGPGNVRRSLGVGDTQYVDRFYYLALVDIQNRYR
jgi:membrane-bound serine protease (ClpP class)